MLIPTLTAAALLWFYFDRKDAKKSEEIIKREKRDETVDYCLKVINSCETQMQLLLAGKLARNCMNKGYVDPNDYHILLKRIWSMTNAIH